ncbi:MAG: hypothetical protein COA79_11505 [Planctomycetota bacterium]|nr:MAG: hypothetical protein COA79_11505 [Planctomycetota bacterium]
MKYLIGLLILSLLSFNVVNAQSLGNDDQSAAAEDAELNNESFPILKIVPYQWVELTEPAKESKIFSPDLRFNGYNSLDEGAEKIDFGFEFKYFGETYRSGYVTINGFLAFGNQGGGAGFIPGNNNSAGTVVNTPSDLIGPNSYGPGKIPSARPPNNVIAPFWADLDFSASGGGYIYYRTFKPEKQDKSFDHFIVEWDSAGFWLSNGVLITFQLVLFPEGGIMFQYKEFSLDDFFKAELLFYQESDFVTEDGIVLSELTEYELIKLRWGVTIGYEDAGGRRGTAWAFSVQTGMSLGNELIPDWVVGANSDQFLDRLDGRDRRNNAVTSDGGGGGCFIAKRQTREDR